MQSRYHASSDHRYLNIKPQHPQIFSPLNLNLCIIACAMPPQLILDRQSDWIVSPEVYIRNGLLKDAHFQAQYQLSVC